MTKHGDKLSDLTIEEVTERLNEESDGKAIKRLVAAREYLDGHSPASISEKFGWPEQTIRTILESHPARCTARQAGLSKPREHRTAMFCRRLGEVQ